ncbi:MAG: hypothetical protein KTR25_04575 [Myxococcales bacterium]|nr:hypothetical protein [Myxococcales bacterium]
MIGFGSVACSGSEDTVPPEVGDLQLALSYAVERWVVPSVRTFEGQADQYSEQAERFCNEPTEGRLERLQDEWRNLSLAWNEMVLFNLGPLDDDLITPKIIRIESKRQRGRDYTETVREEVRRVVEGTFPLDTEYFAKLNFTKSGLLALELLSFDGGLTETSTDTTVLISGFQDTPRRCELLLGIAENVRRCAKEVLSGWEEDFSGEPFQDTLRSGELPDGTNSVAKLIIVAQEHVDYVKQRKIQGVADAQLSGLFYGNMGANISSLRELLYTEPYSFVDHMRTRGFDEEAQSIASALELVESAIEAQLASGPLVAAFETLENGLKNDLPRGLGVELGINFSDGD